MSLTLDSHIQRKWMQVQFVSGEWAHLHKITVVIYLLAEFWRRQINLKSGFLHSVPGVWLYHLQRASAASLFSLSMEPPTPARQHPSPLLFFYPHPENNRNCFPKIPSILAIATMRENRTEHFAHDPTHPWAKQPGQFLAYFSWPSAWLESSFLHVCYFAGKEPNSHLHPHSKCFEVGGDSPDLLKPILSPSQPQFQFWFLQILSSNKPKNQPIDLKQNIGIKNLNM